MIGALVALALLPHMPHWPNPFGPFQAKPGAHEATVLYQLPGWRLSERADAFTGLKSCRLQARDMRYAHGVVTFRFGARTDTAPALFRIDGGPARTAGSVALEAAGLGAGLLTKDTWNPSDGRVHIPAAQLKGARSVSIRPNARTAPRTFAVDTLDAALDAARQRGCSDLA